jgi:DNA-binding GntR family transcriptional regulator
VPLTMIHRNTSLEAAALESIRNAIMDGTLLPGIQLKQNVLAERLGLSQTTIREALIRLGEEGLIEAVPYKGSYVRRLTRDDVREIYDLRATLETHAAHHALPHLREGGTLEKLEALIQPMINAVDAGYKSKAVEADLEFHRYLVELSSNSRLIKVWDSLLAQSRYVLRKLYQLDIPMLPQQLPLNHHEIIAALRSEDLNEIRLVIHEHMFGASETLVQNWDQISREWESVTEDVAAH